MKRSKLGIILLILFLCGCKLNTKKEGLSIVTTSFPCYDLARAVIGDDNNLKMLISPGSEVHTYEPTPQDIIEINKADIFIYIGGESDEWVDDILDSLDNKDLTIVKLFDYVTLLDEDGEEDEYDEHIWTSPKNMIIMLNAIKDTVSKVDSKNKDKYQNNVDLYTSKINEIDLSYQELINNSKQKEIIFADRFPFKYFANYYNLKYMAAFNGCSAESEISAKTLTKLIDEINNNNIKTVFYLELSNQNIADTLVSETGVKKALFQSGQNVTKKDFDSGITLVDILKSNYKALEGALK